jgi:RNA polymerase sigma factor (sigma-70 family)
MCEDARFADSIRRIRAGDDQAPRELLDDVRRRLSPDERRLADLRAEGWEWAEIAARLGITAEACRKQLARALARVEAQLAAREARHE